MSVIPLNQKVIMALILVVIGALVFFSYGRKSESAIRARICREDCAAQGRPGSDFQWKFFSVPKCACRTQP